MKVKFTRNAMLTLKLHCSRIKDFSGAKSARNLRKKIFDKASYLKTFPQMGQKAEGYDDTDFEIRYLVEGNYKIFYQVTKNQVFVIDVADTRQNHEDINPI